MRITRSSFLSTFFFRCSSSRACETWMETICCSIFVKTFRALFVIFFQDQGLLFFFYPTGLWCGHSFFFSISTHENLQLYSVAEFNPFDAFFFEKIELKYSVSALKKLFNSLYLAVCVCVSVTHFSDRARKREIESRKPHCVPGRINQVRRACAPSHE